MSILSPTRSTPPAQYQTSLTFFAHSEDDFDIEHFFDMRAAADQDSNPWAVRPPPIDTNIAPRPARTIDEHAGSQHSHRSSSEMNFSSPADTSVHTPASLASGLIDPESSDDTDTDSSPITAFNHADQYVMLSRPGDQPNHLRATMNPITGTTPPFGQQQQQPQHHHHDHHSFHQANIPDRTISTNQIFASQPRIFNTVPNAPDSFTSMDEMDGMEDSVMSGDDTYSNNTSPMNNSFDHHYMMNSTQQQMNNQGSSQQQYYWSPYRPIFQTNQTMPQSGFNNQAYCPPYQTQSPIQHPPQQFVYPGMIHQLPTMMPNHMAYHQIQMPMTSMAPMSQSPMVVTTMSPGPQSPMMMPIMQPPYASMDMQPTPPPMTSPIAIPETKPTASVSSGSSDVSRRTSKNVGPMRGNARNVQIKLQQSLSPVGGPAPPPRPGSASAPSADDAEHITARNGGRKKGMTLAEPMRQIVNKMRKHGACWPCAITRDQCDDQDTCARCQGRSQRGAARLLPCSRVKLPEMVDDLLPPTMKWVHLRQSIEDYVCSTVRIWHKAEPIDVYFTTGYGPALRWTVYEFTPSSLDLLKQYQYIQTKPGECELVVKYAPPYGLLAINPGDQAHFENYLDVLMSDQHIADLGKVFYAEESVVDPEKFQARLLTLMCKFYIDVDAREQGLKKLVGDVLRMCIITYIMGHTLTITDDTLSAVLTSVRHTAPNHNSAHRHLSPRLANRQLKFYFNALREETYKNLLKWQQARLKDGKLPTSTTKEQTWLQSFCAVLGFAMVLEEVQRTLFIQADANIKRADKEVDAAILELRNACARIDVHFSLLIQLFQCKFRNKIWGSNGSFGPCTPTFGDLATIRFLQGVRQLVERRRDHLEARERVEFSLANQCLYTTRLTAKFLLPFLNLPQTG